ncbi:MAG: hypothetical protein QNJ55_27140 [Xenococcus sp. MO_188.B8]|nr:hypothetical protein [Xenococcus sp. MO_188.B8]
MLNQNLNQFAQASEIIKDSYFTHESITTEEIQKELDNYLDNLIEEINNEPLFFLKENNQFWKKLDNICLRKAEKSQPKNVA